VLVEPLQMGAPTDLASGGQGEEGRQGAGMLLERLDAQQFDTPVRVPTNAGNLAV
jgi:hypothetical protein